jgi:hypothetical protein
MLPNFQVLLGLLNLLILAGCGKGFEANQNATEDLRVLEYHANLLPLNPKYGVYRGWMRLSITENQFWARVKVSGPKTQVMHGQHIHVSNRCPQMSDDTNQDGFIDFMEVINVSGPILIPLDANLTTQQKGIFDFPRMRRQPFYYYSEATKLDWLMDDLWRDDVIRDDYITKLRPGSKLQLERRAVIIYGIDEDQYLPSTVRSSPGYPGHRTFPIACGQVRPGSPGTGFD